MKLISWNVNGLRAVINKGFKDFYKCRYNLLARNKNATRPNKYRY